MSCAYALVTAMTSLRLFPYFVKFWQWQPSMIQILRSPQKMQSDCQKDVQIILFHGVQQKKIIFKLE